MLKEGGTTKLEIMANKIYTLGDRKLYLCSEDGSGDIEIGQAADPGQATFVRTKLWVYDKTGIVVPGEENQETALTVTNNSEQEAARALKVNGKAEIAGQLQVTSEIDAISDALYVGHNSSTNGVYVGRGDEETVLNGSYVQITPDLFVGVVSNGGLARIDANGDFPADELDLQIGSQNATRDVKLSRTGQKTIVKGRLDAEEHIRVGTSAVDGEIDCQANNRDLKVGTDTTQNVILSQAGQTIDMFGQARMNSNAVIMNNADDIINANGCGHVFNPNGQGATAPSIDHYINGVCTFYVDSTGGHNNV